MDMRDDTREKLKTVSTATLTTVLFKRGFRNCFIQGVHLINPDAPRMVGPAYTLRYIPAREDLDHLGVFEDRTHPQRKGVEECPPGAVFAIDSRKNHAAASAGGILVTRLMKRGCAGIVTDGGFRDTPETRRCRSRPITRIRPRRRTSSAIMPPTSTCRSPAATWRSIRATSWSATARASP
jgi:regulator of RNase E activity RraA